MDKQQFDHIDNRIRQAADEISVPFNEDAWKRMEVKLDNEFSEKRRRGFVWWWFSFILISFLIVGIYFFNNPSNNHSIFPSKITDNISSLTASHSTTNKDKKAEPRIVMPENRKTEKPDSKEQKDITANKKRDETILSIEQPDKSETSPQKNEVAKNLKEDHINADIKNLTSHHLTKGIQRDKVMNLPASNDNLLASQKAGLGNPATQTTFYTPGKDFINKRRTSEDRNGNHVEKNENNSQVVPGTVIDAAATTVVTDKVKTSVPPVQKDSLISVDSASKKSPQVKLDRPSSNGFYFIASAAGDATGIKNIPIEYIKPVYGLGIGYRFNKRLSAQTGFFFGKKIYSAGPDDYKTKPGSYIAKFISAEADCYIYDIPLTLRYDLINKRASTLYFTSGLSSYILKRETYDMHFLNPAGAYRHMPYTYKHNLAYLSVFNLSLGYERKLTNALYVQAEPYLKVPLAGLGEGSAKLYSAGLQLGIKYQPLKKKK